MFDRDEIAQLTASAVSGRKQKASGRNGVVVSSHPIVSRVAVNVLNDGGNAVDAVLAASLAQTVVEPHMTTAFGVLSMMHYDKASGATQYINGSMNAPLAGLPGFSAADMATGRSVAVPGFWSAWEASRERYAKKSREVLAAPAIELARTGFPDLSVPLRHDVREANKIGLTEEGRGIYFRDNVLRGPGSSWSITRSPTHWSGWQRTASTISTAPRLPRKWSIPSSGPAASSRWRISTVMRRAGWIPPGVAIATSRSPARLRLILAALISSRF